VVVSPFLNPAATLVLSFRSTTRAMPWPLTPRSSSSSSAFFSAHAFVAAGFKNGDTTTYAIVQGFGGELQLFAITIDAVARAGASDYLAIGMPGYLHAKDFGARAIGVQTDANVPLTSSLGSLLLNGTASMTGQLNLWAK
jgi:hypothetical protein